jgi:hypothetical protein
LNETDRGDRCCSIELNDVANGVIAKIINAYKGEYPREAVYSKIRGIIVK